MSFEESDAEINGSSDGDPHVLPQYSYLTSPKDDKPTDTRVEIPPLPIRVETPPIPPPPYQASATQTQEIENMKEYLSDEITSDESDSDTLKEYTSDETSSDENHSDTTVRFTNSASRRDESKHTKPNDEQVVDRPGPSTAKKRQRARKNAKKKEKKAAKRAAAQTKVQHEFVFDYHMEHDSVGWYDRHRRDEEASRDIKKWARTRKFAQLGSLSTPKRVQLEGTTRLDASAAAEGLLQLTGGLQQSKEANGVESKTSDQETRNEERSDLPSEVQPQPPRSTDTIGDSAGEADGKTQVRKKAEESLPKAPSPPILETQQNLS
ncbi:hypothetical protein F5X96DRAFT_47780 [Biscogniauxia mediterranea]|nr:hypothetical protein F5X96DRAFT_47780 [Biscogniauxia mediterranea]